MSVPPTSARGSRFAVRPKLLRIVGQKAESFDGVQTLNGYSTAYCVSRTLETIHALLSEALRAGRENTTQSPHEAGLLVQRDVLLELSGLLLACAEQAQRDRDSILDQEAARV